MQSKFVALLSLLLVTAIIGIVVVAQTPQNQRGGLPPLSDAEYEQYIARKTEELFHAPTAAQKKLVIATPRDAPKVTLRGKVLMPDGSPAPRATITANSVAFILTPDGKNCSQSTSGRTQGIKQDGTFQIEDVTLGSNVIISVSTIFRLEEETLYKKLVAEPLVLVALDRMKPLEIKLVEGIPVRGKIKYDNGTVAADRRLDFVQYAVPALGFGIPELNNNLKCSRQCLANAEGEYEIYLLPGGYTVEGAGKTETLTIAKTDKEKRLDWTMPTPIFVEVTREDGTPPGRLKFTRMANDGVRVGTYTSYSKEDGTFFLEPITHDQRLYISDEKEQGTIEAITPDMAGKTVQFKLKPMGKVTLTLVDSDGKPVVDEQVSLSIKVEVPMATSSFGGSSAVTDAEGKVTLRVAPGKIRVELDSSSFREQQPNGGFRILHALVKELNLAPGETFDFGVVKLAEGRRLR